MDIIGLLYFIIINFQFFINIASSATDLRDVSALLGLKDGWQNPPSSWDASSDPCEPHPWGGVRCKNARVIGLDIWGVDGHLNDAIGNLTELKFLHLSDNPNLTGSLPPELGHLQKLTALNLRGCNFTGNIPSEIGNLAELVSLDLSSNKLSGEIPSLVGKLSNLYWLDLSDNQLIGNLPVSTSDISPGLDLLKHAKHFHFQRNRLSGIISYKLFSSDMTLKQISFEENEFEGSIPLTIGLVKTLTVLRLNNNSFSGRIPSNINNLTSLLELNLANNKFSGPLPDLSGMNSLDFLDLSNNSFEVSEAPAWLLGLQSLTTLAIEYGPFQGPLQIDIFGLPQIQQVKLKNNNFNALALGANISQQLQLIDLQNNNISMMIEVYPFPYKNPLLLRGNPICEEVLNGTKYCKV